MTKKQEPVFEIINNNNDMQMNIIIKKIIEETLTRDRYNIKLKKNIEIPESTKIDVIVESNG